MTQPQSNTVVNQQLTIQINGPSILPTLAQLYVFTNTFNTTYPQLSGYNAVATPGAITVNVPNTPNQVIVTFTDQHQSVGTPGVDTIVMTAKAAMGNYLLQLDGAGI